MVHSPSWEASQEIPRILWNSKVHYRTHKRPPHVPILCQPNTVHIPASHLLEIHPNIIHPSTSRSPQRSLSVRFPHQDPIHPLSLAIRATSLAHLIRLDFITRTILGEEYKSIDIHTDTKNIRHRVTQAWKIIGVLNRVWWLKDVTKTRKKVIYNSMVKSVLNYGTDTWSIFEDDRRRVNATEMEALRRSAGISKLRKYVDGETNEYIREKMKAQDTIFDEITRKQLIWYGHVERLDPTRLPKIMDNWKPEGRKKRGRPWRKGKDRVYTEMSERGLRMGEWNCRGQWNMEDGRRRQTFWKRAIYIKS